MTKTDKTIVKETKFVALCVFILSVIMQVIFVLLSKWNYTVLLGNILGAVAIVVNFYVMGIYVKKAVAKDENEAKKIIKTSQTIRTFFLFIVLMLGVLAPCFSTIATIIPLFFLRISIMIRPLWKDKKDNNKEVALNE